MIRREAKGRAGQGRAGQGSAGQGSAGQGRRMPHPPTNLSNESLNICSCCCIWTPQLYGAHDFAVFPPAQMRLSQSLHHQCLWHIEDNMTCILKYRCLPTKQCLNPRIFRRLNGSLVKLVRLCVKQNLFQGVGHNDVETSNISSIKNGSRGKKPKIHELELRNCTSAVTINKVILKDRSRLNSDLCRRQCYTPPQTLLVIL